MVPKEQFEEFSHESVRWNDFWSHFGKPLDDPSLPPEFFGQMDITIRNWLKDSGQLDGDSKRESRGERTGVLAPADLQATVVEGEALVGGDLVEGESSRRINERDELEHKSVS